MSETGVAPRFPLGGSRAAVFALQARKGRPTPATLLSLAAVREHVDHLAVVVGGLDAEGRAVVDSHCDEVVTVASDVTGLWAYAAALRAWGSRESSFDEIILTGDGWFGPISPLAPVIERMDVRYVDMWSLTDRREGRPHDRSEGRDGEVRLSTYWLAVRRRVRESEAWRRFWTDLPSRPDHGWQVRQIESSLSEVVVQAGFRIGAAFPSDDYPAEHADTFNVDLLVEDGCPAVTREVFDGYPLFYDQHAIVGRRIAAAMATRGYPVGLMWSDLARSSAPKRLHTNGAMLEILPPVERASRREPLRVIAVVHVVDTIDIPDIMARLVVVPGLARCVFTLADENARPAVEAAWRSACAAEPIPFETRPATARRTPDTIVVFDECRDVVNSDDADLILALHTGVDPKMSRNARRYFRRQQLDCLLGDGPGYTANLIELFRREPELGLVFPPTPHIGMSTLGDGWLGHREQVERHLDRLGVDVPLDWASPHAPLGGMWWARPEAVRRLAEERWGTGPDVSAVHSRLHAYVAGDRGYYTRTVATSEHAGLSHGSLEYIGDHMAMTSYGYPAGYTALLHRAGPVGSGRAVDFARMWLRYRHPDWLRAASVVGRVARGARRVTRGLRAHRGGN
ncbi:lipopolysaccharide biosynthesis protein [Microbacterium sp. SORGH_AS 1204]|uniref:rhamnan synthesis F family protein n=1 Tax=Microbacterium sp. SORGH_AS_1204 TaxID=3041785 RepID=UPI00278D6B41|nr:rhamnan synthesis F family protein [Microbacterium sp. SORGH_AS_1204]MDQ1137600.1 lipopolysaccharide biosynthesis protein [Microbacterium sp. SORGH_AS_1204]